MGEVYRARDSRLGREVAVKILSGNLCLDRRSIERFEQEARSASALNHPNIVTIYELGEVDTTCYIAMELVGRGGARPAGFWLNSATKGDSDCGPGCGRIGESA